MRFLKALVYSQKLIFKFLVCFPFTLWLCEMFIKIFCCVSICLFVFSSIILKMEMVIWLWHYRQLGLASWKCFVTTRHSVLLFIYCEQNKRILVYCNSYHSVNSREKEFQVSPSAILLCLKALFHFFEEIVLECLPCAPYIL